VHQTPRQPDRTGRDQLRILVGIGAFFAAVVVIGGIVSAVNALKGHTSAAASPQRTAAAASAPTPAAAPAPNSPATGAGKASKPKARPNVGSELRDLDMADGVSVEPTATYEQAFAALSAKCQEQGVPLGNGVDAVLKLLKKKGVTDETRLTVMQHLAESIPGPQKMSVADVGGAYVTLRTSGG
jgi:hypothetical protein